MHDILGYVLSQLCFKDEHAAEKVETAFDIMQQEHRQCVVPSQSHHPHGQVCAPLLPHQWILTCSMPPPSLPWGMEGRHPSGRRLGWEGKNDGYRPSNLRVLQAEEVGGEGCFARQCLGAQDQTFRQPLDQPHCGVRGSLGLSWAVSTYTERWWWYLLEIWGEQWVLCGLYLQGPILVLHDDHHE